MGWRIVGEWFVGCRKLIDYASKRHDGSSISTLLTSDGCPILSPAERSLFFRELVLLAKQLVLLRGRRDREQALQLLEPVPDLVRPHASQGARHRGVRVFEPALLLEQLLQ